MHTCCTKIVAHVSKYHPRPVELILLVFSRLQSGHHSTAVCGWLPLPNRIALLPTLSFSLLPHRYLPPPRALIFWYTGAAAPLPPSLPSCRPPITIPALAARLRQGNRISAHFEYELGRRRSPVVSDARQRCVKLNERGYTRWRDLVPTTAPSTTTSAGLGLPLMVPDVSTGYSNTGDEQ